MFLFTGGFSMNSRTRSVLGAAIAILLIPAVIGILACLPVPIGDPERSEIDPYFSGLWVHDIGGAVLVANFEPYDKRTWLLAQIGIERTDDCTGDPPDTMPESYAALVGEVEKHGEDCYAGEVAQLYKVWLSELGGQWFMTWELRGLPPLEEKDELYWYVSRVEKVDADNLMLWVIDKDFEEFEEIQDSEGARQAYEAVIGENVGNDEMYMDDPWAFQRVQEGHEDLMKGIINDVISHD